MIVNDGAECGSTGVLGVCFFFLRALNFGTYDTRPTAALFSLGILYGFHRCFCYLLGGWLYDIVLRKGGVQILALHPFGPYWPTIFSSLGVFFLWALG